METDNELGTTDINQKATRNKKGKIDFKKELQILRKELKKLGLRDADSE